MNARRILRLLGWAFACAILPLLAACTAKQATDEAPTYLVNQEASSIEPKLVVQVGHQAPVVAVAWLNDGENLVSLAGDGSILVWEVATRLILNRAQVPSNWRSLGIEGCMAAEPITVDEKTGNVSISYVEHLGDGELAEIQADKCPNLGRYRRSRFTFWFNVKNWDPIGTQRSELDDTKLQQAASALWPFSYERADLSEEQQKRIEAGYFPESPDRRWVPVAESPASHGDPESMKDFSGFEISPEEYLAWQQKQTEETYRTLALADVGLAAGPVAQVTAYSAFGPKNVIRPWSIRLAPVSGSGHFAWSSLSGSEQSYITDAELSGDGQQLAIVEGSGNEQTVKALDIANGMRTTSFKQLPGLHYESLSWWGDQFRLYVPDSGFYTPGKRGTWSGVGIPLHFTPPGPPDPDPWRLKDRPELKGQVVTATEVWYDGGKLAVATKLAGVGTSAAASGKGHSADTTPCDAGPPLQAPPTSKQKFRVFLFDLNDSETEIAAKPAGLLSEFTPDMLKWKASGAGGPKDCLKKYDGYFYKDPAEIGKLEFSKGGSYLFFSIEKSQTFSGTDASTGLFDLHVSKTTGDEPEKMYRVSSRKVESASDDLLFGFEGQELINLATGRTIRYHFDQPLIRVGYIERSRLFWTVSRSGQVHLANGDTGAQVLTLYSFPNNQFFAVMPGGRYDTNLSPDSELVRWVVPDEPWQSLPAQTFMRDFYEPGLYRKVLACHAAGNCEDVFKTLPSIEKLNRVVPRVTVTDVAYSEDGRTATVTIEAKDGGKPGGKQSGIYDLRLYRNGREVARIPDVPDVAVDPTEDPDQRIKEWRATHKLPETKSGHYVITVPAQTAAWHGEDVDFMDFTAYAFNESRIKSFSYTYHSSRDGNPNPRKPQAYVLNVGIDAYDRQAWNLNYSVNDARLMAARLSNIFGFQTHQTTLLSQRLGGGRMTRVDAATFEQVLGQIAADATPDDIIIVTYAGHGWADPQGNFYLAPTDAKLAKGASHPDPASLISSTALTNILRSSQAGEIALILDACQSAASVASGGFKPGPMGDAGLGQLAYDKGILILAASQADGVAHESDKVKHGLLTFALADEGLRGDTADLDGDSVTRLDEWLEYAVQRLPTLQDDVGNKQWDKDSHSWRDLVRGEGKDKIQRPSLFDFTRTPSRVTVHRQLRAVVVREPPADATPGPGG